MCIEIALEENGGSRYKHSTLNKLRRRPKHALHASRSAHTWEGAEKARMAKQLNYTSATSTSQTRGRISSVAVDISATLRDILKPKKAWPSPWKNKTRSTVVSDAVSNSGRSTRGTLLFASHQSLALAMRCRLHIWYLLLWPWISGHMYAPWRR